MLLAGLVALSACILPPGVASGPAGEPVPDLDPYRGLGTWVDVWDYVPALQAPGRAPALTVESVDAMAWVGIRTLYLQVSRDHPRLPGDLADPELVGALLERAHQRGIRVVAWYLPTFADLERDWERLSAIWSFRHRGHQFDGIAVDIEATDPVPDVGERNRRLIELSRRLRDLVGPAALGAIVLPPVVTDVINRSYWPDFPWAELAPLYDVWLPMGYWTNRRVGSEWRDAHRYTSENIRLLRGHVGADAVVHAIGGIADEATPADYQGFVRAAREQGAIGASVYDVLTTAPSSWPLLRTGAPS